ncbi:hypothetical protein GCM10011332_32300 [Terasakiella brassicae]|uniref:Uncharacterized protein n=1 Tax=Terasakiella brassicae TaxID=1634917 RepID=A0A917C7G6_9PROT|nr:hypothetical protein GCM10011332_32300 [Terasakiella brassicae]
MPATESKASEEIIMPTGSLSRNARKNASGAKKSMGTIMAAITIESAEYLNVDMIRYPFTHTRKDFVPHLFP